MKLIIDIPNNQYNQICELRLHNRTIYDDAIRKGIPLDNMTNGEVIRALFPNTITVHRIREGRREMVYSDEWWNKKYRKEIPNEID